MSIGFGKSFQYVGLNRAGAYMSVSRDKGARADRSVGATTADVNRRNEIWRRITGIFEGVAQSAKDRKRGLRLLTKRIQERVRRATPHPRPLSHRERGENSTAAAALLAERLSISDEWEFNPDDWVRVQNSGVSIEAMCVELGCSRARLTALLKEYCGMSASEFLDGLKFSRLRTAMMGRLREAAVELWGFPGAFVAVKLQREVESHDGESLLCDPDRRTPHPGLASLVSALSHKGRGENGGGGRCAGGKRSRFFRTRPEELFEESRGDERARRVSELCAMLRRDFHLESWAISAGYESGAKLKRACLNVLGRNLEKLERALAAEVVQFYFCAEDRELREIALRDDGSVITGRARELYHGSDDMPVPPFEDEYAKFEELKAEWLSRMRELLI